MKQLLISVDQLLNTLLGPVLNRLYFGGPGPWGHPDETISSVLGKFRYAGILADYQTALWLYRFLNWLEPDHCEKSVEWAVGWSPYAIQQAAR